MSDTPNANALAAALQAIVDWKPALYDFPPDWSERVDLCEECARWRGHPIQQGICDTHRRPLWAREAHDKHQDVARGSAMWLIAHDALAEWRRASGIEAATADETALGGSTVGDSAVAQPIAHPRSQSSQSSSGEIS